MPSSPPVPPAAGPEPTRRARRAGRNVPLATAIGLVLGALALGSIYLIPHAFPGLVIIFAALGAVELNRAFAPRMVAPLPVVLVSVGVVAVVAGATVRGVPGITVALVAVLLIGLAWRIHGGPEGYLADLGLALLIWVYLAVLGSFVVLLYAGPHGENRTVLYLIVVVCSDVGGFAAGVLFGKHPLAPTISPKKTWEGLAGSVLFCVVGGTVGMVVLLDGSWWGGMILGLAIAAVATAGDLVESTMKRDLGIKDMGSLLPGHGGVMDRLDSLLVCAPVAWAILGLALGSV